MKAKDIIKLIIFIISLLVSIVLFVLARKNDNSVFYTIGLMLLLSTNTVMIYTNRKARKQEDKEEKKEE